MDASELCDRVIAGDRRAVARAISAVEDSDPTPIVTRLHPRGGNARAVGITGAPGSGKSTLVDRLITEARNRGLTVAILAIDPSSPFTGGAVLGDRVRMQDHTSDPGVYIRSMSTRGALGGVSTATEAAAVVLDAAGFDLILVETVGVGQSEVDVMRLVETTVVVVAPGFGDGIQAAKAGVLEIGDVFVVNKADLPGTELVVRDLTQMLEMGRPGPWDPPIVQVSALDGSGVADAWKAIENHGEFLSGPHAVAGRRQRADLAIRRALLGRLGRQVEALEIPEELVSAVVSRQLDPWQAAVRLYSD